jgi:proline iminopeptidase
MANTTNFTHSRLHHDAIFKQDQNQAPEGQGVRLRMIPVGGGKYKVWTKKIGSGPVKVLLLHGGPGFTHDYLEAMESFLP